MPYLFQENSPNPGQFTAKLIINEVMEKDAGSTNILTVTNELGTTKYPFTLSLGDKPASGEQSTLGCEMSFSYNFIVTHHFTLS